MDLLPTGTVTFLFTDIEGSTQLWQRHPQAMPAALARHHELLRSAIEAHKGYVFQIIGDAFCAAFHTAPDGLRAALDAQRALQAEAWGECGPIRVRMALHSGAVEIRPGDTTSGEYVSNLTLSRAARLLSAGHGRQVLLSRATTELLAYDLPDGLGLRDLGQRRLKDLQQPEHIYQLTAADLPLDFPALKTLDALPNNLPVQLTSFIGRERELAQLKKYLFPLLPSLDKGAEPARLLTLTGVGGTGKTRLALQAAAEVLEEYPDGVWLVELASISDPQFLTHSIASVMHLSEQPGRQLIELLQDALRNRRLLFVLDNCEHITEAVARLADRLLRGCPKIQILATSREPLGIAGETIWSVPSLALPQAQASLDELEQCETIRLFVERAAAARPSFALSEANATAVARICRRLDGIPLAIELAASRVKVLSPEQIAVRLDDRFRLLTGGSRTALPRQQTLQALIDWSFSLLSEQERSLFQRLSVFAGGWTLEAAETVCAGNSAESFDLLDLLAHLVDKSLVMSEERDGEARYHMLETIHQYARERLFESGEAVAIHQRHLEWMLGLGKAFEAAWYFRRESRWMSRMDLEQDNLRAAMNWGLEQPADLELAYELAGAVWPYWYFRGHWVEGRQWVERLLQAGEGLPVSPGARGKVLYIAAAMTYFQGETEAAKTYTRLSQQACREAHDQLGLAINLHHAGDIAMTEGKLAEAERLLQEGLILAQKLGNGLWESVLIIDLGNLYAHYYKDLAQAYELFQQSLSLSIKLGLFTHYSLTNLADTCLRLGWLEKAHSYIEEAKQANQERYEERIQGFIMDREAQLAFEEGKHLTAQELWLECLEFAWKIRERDEVLNRLEDLARVAILSHVLEKAARILGAVTAARKLLPLPSLEPEKATNMLAELRAQMVEAKFESAWTEGLALSLDAVVEQVLSQRVARRG
jgi:predicted ATPase/class 3 adenylate cyclase